MKTISIRRQRRCVGAIRGIGDGRRSSVAQRGAGLCSAADPPMWDGFYGGLNIGGAWDANYV